MKHCFIINPTAGKGNFAEELSACILRTARRLILDYEIYLTSGPGDATEYVRENCTKATSPVRFYSCGGDGTFQEVVVGMLRCPYAEAAIIPCGSGNDFVRSFPNPGSFSSLEDQINGSPVPCDLLQVNDRYAVNLCNIGFDADIAYHMDKFKRLPFISGSGAYNISLVFNLLKKLGKKVTVQLDGEDFFPAKILLAAAANGRFYGGGYEAAPLAKLDDGIIDFCRVDKISRFRIAGFVRFYKNGQHLETPGLKRFIHYKKCRSLRITSDKTLRFVLDGEPYSVKDVMIRVLPGAFSLSIPFARRTAADSETIQ